MDDRLRATGDDDVSQTVAQVLDGVHERLGARRARARDRSRIGARAEVEGQVPRCGVGHQHGHRHGQDPSRAFLAERVPGVEERPESADPRGEVDAESLGRDLGCPGIRPRLHRGDERELRRRVEALGDGTFQHGVGTHLRLRGEGHGQLVLLYPVVLQGAGAGRTCEQGVPALGGGGTDGAGCPDAGDDDARVAHVFLVMLRWGFSAAERLWPPPRAVQVRPGST